MIKSTLSFLVFIFLIQSLQGQNLLTETTNWKINSAGLLFPYSKTTLAYDEYGNIISEVSTRWDNDQKSFEDYYYIVKEYNSSNQLTFESLVEIDREEHYTIFDRENIYQNGCIETSTLQYYNRDNIVNRKTVRHNNTNTCKTDSIYIYHRPIDTLLIDSVQLFVNEENLQVIYTYLTDIYGNVNVELNSELRIITNDKGLEVSRRRIHWWNSPEHATLITTEYDQHDNIVLIDRVNMRPDGIYPYRQYAYEYTYDEEDKMLTLVYKDRFTATPSSFTINYTKDFEYYCDGLLKQQTIEYPNAASNNIFISKYHYQKGHDCEINKEELEVEVSIRPNVVRDQILIESKILQTEDCQISVYDLSGKRILTVKIPGRIQSYFLDLNDLPFGQYILHIFSDKHSVTERVLKI